MQKQRQFVVHLLIACLVTIPSVACAGTWTPTGDMVVGSVNQSFGALLPDGKVLVTGGWELSTAEVFDPGRGEWSLTGSMTTGRNEPTGEYWSRAAIRRHLVPKSTTPRCPCFGRLAL